MASPIPAEFKPHFTAVAGALRNAVIAGANELWWINLLGAMTLALMGRHHILMWLERRGDLKHLGQRTWIPRTRRLVSADVRGPSDRIETTRPPGLEPG